MYQNKIIKMIIHQLLFFNPVKKLFRKKSKQVVNSILYHDVGTNINNIFDGKHKLSVSLDIFEKQIKWLNEYFNIILPEDTFAETIDNKPKLIITFDDGYYGVLKNALPILKKYNLPAVIFLNKKFINNKLFPDFIKENALKYFNKNENDILTNNNIITFLKEKYIHEKIFLDDTDCKIIENDYVDLIKFGCHTFSHHNIMTLTKEELLLELEKNSLVNFKNYTNSFSIPFGVYKKHYDENSLNILSDYGFKYIFLNNGCLNTEKNMKFKSLFLIDRVIAPNSYSKSLFINLVENISLKNAIYLLLNKKNRIARL